MDENLTHMGTSFILSSSFIKKKIWFRDHIQKFVLLRGLKMYHLKSVNIFVMPNVYSNILVCAVKLGLFPSSNTF